MIDLLKENGIGNSLIDGIAGQVAGAAADSFLAKPTGEALTTASSSMSSRECP